MSQAIFRISDGTTTINLLNRNGYHVDGWNPETAQYKQGGYFQQSALANWRRLVDRRFENITETIPLVAHGFNADSLARESQDLRRLLEKAADYWATDWQNEPVYIETKAKCETNIRRAYVMQGRVTDGPIFSQPFLQPSNDALFERVSLIVERLHWHASPSSGAPTIGVGVSGTSKALWNYEALWTMYPDLGALTDLPAPVGGYKIVTTSNNVIVGDTSSGGAGDMYYSTDKGVTWVASTTNKVINDFLRISDSYILASEAGSNNILVSTDEGASFSVLSLDIGGGPLIRLQDGTLLSSNDNNEVYQSIDNGVNWTLNDTLSSSGDISGFAQSPTTGTIVAVLHISDTASIRDELWRSTDNGVNWTNTFSSTFQISQWGTEKGSPVSVKSNGDFLTTVSDNNSPYSIYKSIDDGQSWQGKDLNLSGLGYVIYVDSNDNIYLINDSGVAGSVYVYKSVDSDPSLFDLEFQGSGEFYPTKMVEQDDGDFFVGGFDLGGGLGGFTYNTNSSNPVQGEFGGDSDTLVGIANKYNEAQLTHIFVDDGGAFGSNLFPVSAAFDMYPAVPVVNDAIYFGSQTSIDGGPFSSLLFNIASSASSTTSFTITWEYYNGATWATLDVTDDTQSFRLIGPNTVAWLQPTAWASTSVNGVTAFWVRARISAITGTMTPPNHDNSPLVTFVAPYFDIVAGEVGGDVPALARIQAENQSESDAVSNAYTNRIITGLRSYDRGPQFRAYLNAADVQIPAGVILTLGTNCAYANDRTAATGRRVTYSPAGVEAIANRVSFTLATSLASDFYGVYHAFLRVERSGGNGTDFTLQLQINTGSGGVTFTSKTVQPGSSAITFELLDFGQIEISPATILNRTDRGDTLSIIVQASAASGTPDLYIYDLVLIPVDEWAGDFVDGANISGSRINEGELLDIDSIEHPKRVIRSLAKDVSGFVYSIYNPITNGPAILQNNQHQRLWFLAARTSATGSTYQWLGPHGLLHTVDISKLVQYLGLRGDR